MSHFGVAVSRDNQPVDKKGHGLKKGFDIVDILCENSKVNFDLTLFAQAIKGLLKSLSKRTFFTPTFHSSYWTLICQCGNNMALL